jgi:hypothetical protein
LPQKKNTRCCIQWCCCTQRCHNQRCWIHWCWLDSGMLNVSAYQNWHPKNQTVNTQVGHWRLDFIKEWVRNFTFGSFLLDTQILNVKKQLRLQKLCQTPIVLWVDGDHRVLLSYPYKQNNKHFSMWVLLLV